MIARYGTARAATAVAPADRRRRDARGVRPHGAGERIRRGRAPDEGPVGRRRVGDRRLEVVHHEQRDADHRLRRRGVPHRGGLGQRRLHDPRAGRRARVLRRTPVQEARMAFERHPRAVLRGMPGAGGEPPRRARARASRSASRRSTTDGSRSRRSRSGSRRDASMRASRYAKDREAFGRPIGAYEAIAFKLADMRATIDAARLLTYRAAWLKDQGRPYTTEAAIAKLRASETAVDVAREAIQVHGGLRLHGGVPGRPRLPRREGARDRRRHERDPPPRDRARPRSPAAGLTVPSGRYAVRGRSGDVVGTEDFRCAPGPMGWRYFSEIQRDEPTPHREIVDVVGRRRVADRPREDRDRDALDHPRAARRARSTGLRDGEHGRRSAGGPTCTSTT